ncbi:OX-2 membrane glycoprotein-like isoform X2 [Dasypus novemcinctus]
MTTQADVMQVTWQKIQDSLPQNIGTYSSKYGEKILPPYLGRLHCEIIEPNSSLITIREVTFEDEACYQCLFNVFPHGSYGGRICLNILTVSELKTEVRFNLSSEDFLTVINSAMGKPAPQISLLPSQVLINPPVENLVQNPNGIVTVTKLCNVSLETARFLRLQHLIVRLDHPLKKEEKIVPLLGEQEYIFSYSHNRLPIVGAIITFLLVVLVTFLPIFWRKKKAKNSEIAETRSPWSLHAETPHQRKKNQSH